MAIYTGTIYDDTLAGTQFADEIYGQDGDDFIQGLSGRDTLFGGADQDYMHGGKGDDEVHGDAGDDKLYGGDGWDYLYGGDGLDALKGEDGNDVLIGGARHDALTGGAGQDTFLYTALTDSTYGDVDIIYDFEHGIDKIDLRALGYTGFTAGTASAAELRIAYSAASDRTYLRDDHSDFEIALKGDYRGVVDNGDFRFAVPGVSVGYYEAVIGSGSHNPAYAAPINNLGYDAVSLDNLRSADLAGLSAVFLLNQSNEGYPAELLAALPALADYVAHGGVLIIHDAFVDGAESLLPGLTGEDIVRNVDDGRNVDFVHDGGLIAQGPGGHLNDSSLDQGYYSSHGYTLDASLGSDVVRVQTTGDPSHIVSFAYAYGLGAVYYSSIPLTAYLPLANADDLVLAMRAYAENVIGWAVQGHHDLDLL